MTDFRKTVETGVDPRLQQRYPGAVQKDTFSTYIES